MRRVAFGFLLVFAVGCKKEEDPTTKPPPKGRESVVNAGLGAAQSGTPAGAAKGALVAQQCALACGARPELEGCTQRCLAECRGASDLAAIDACAAKIASPK